MGSKRKIGKIVIDRERCKGCHMCIEVCPTKNIEEDKIRNKKGYHPARFKEGKKDQEKEQKECTGCAQCGTVCPEIAIEVYHAE